MTGTIRFLLDEEIVQLDEPDPSDTLLNLLRYRLRRTGTKEGCAEGDCGACTVLVGEVAQDELVWRAMNACILLLPMLNGRAVITVESLSRGGTPHPLQMVMAANGSSQCGFCTPGFVMSLYGRSIGASGCDLPLSDVIAGNLCRCTGYGPILAAGKVAPPQPRSDSTIIAALESLKTDLGAQGTFGGNLWFTPRSVAELCDILAEHPDAHLVAGATDVGLWITKGLRTLPKLVFIADVTELQQLRESESGLHIGAAVRYADAHRALGNLHPDLGELVRRIGGLQVRNAGTVCGNIANGSPIGDGPPALIALGAQLTLRGASGQRTMALEDYFLDYGKQDRRPGEFVESVFVPRPNPNDIVHISKLSKRYDSDISAVCGAFALTVVDDRIVRARIAFGGMAATPSRAWACEGALADAPFTLETIERAAALLGEDFTPLDDVRGSAAYRLAAAANLLRRLWYISQSTQASILDVEPVDG